jgi:hypothetical protein
MDTAGSMMHVDPIQFNRLDLTQLTWKATVSEYEYNESTPHGFRLRIEFNSVGFMCPERYLRRQVPPAVMLSDLFFLCQMQAV